MGRAGPLDDADALDAQVADVVEEPLPRPEQDRGHVDLELVDTRTFGSGVVYVRYRVAR